MDREMNVLKRDGNREVMTFDKILHRIKSIASDEGIRINFSILVIKIIDQLFDDIETRKIDELIAEQCASQVTHHPDYGVLASRVVMSNYHKNTSEKFSDVVEMLYNSVDARSEVNHMVSKSLYDTTLKYKDILDGFIDHSRDKLIDYFGFKTLEKNYLFSIRGTPVERVQHMWMRVALCIHGENMDAVKETYDLMSQKYFTHATPTLYNAGTPRPQLSSCYLLAMESDSIDGIYNTLKDCATISKYAGGIGFHIHNIRASGSHIRGTNGVSNGIVPMLRVFNNTARYVDQGGGKRNGSFAVYVEPWHADIVQFLELKKNRGNEELKARDLFYALWIPDLFMRRVKDNAKWTLMCPDTARGLQNVYGTDFDELYVQYENSGLGRETVDARELWMRILDSQMETGNPYLLYKDACNSKSNQKHLGTIKSSNLCTEIMEYSDENETAVCNLASISLSSIVSPEKTVDYDNLHYITKVVVNNINNIIDINFYPTEKTKRSNMRHRPMGVGVQGLADMFALLDICFDSDEAREINRLVFETMYHAALEKSNELAMNRYTYLANEYASDPMRAVEDACVNDYEVDAVLSAINDGHAYFGAHSSFKGSPASEGILQFDMWGVSPSDRYDWAGLKDSIKKYGIRNSLLLAPMPTASTAQILGNNECFEPFTSNIYSRRTLSGEFMVVNKYLMSDLIKLDMWNTSLKNNIIANKGSIQQVVGIPQHIRDKYKTVWEMSMKHVINMAKDRGAFICQSQSMNLWQQEPNYNNLTSMHFYAWSAGLKTGMYYLRRKPKHDAQQFTIDPSTQANSDATECEMCSG